MSGHLQGKICSFDLPYFLFALCLFVIIVISNFDFEGGTLVLIASVDWSDAYLYLSLVVRKPVFGVSDQVPHEPACTATEGG